ncbi:hypothetical protein EV177_007790 [Coemansia sp. RSA 1804]|nr:hypothetical protein EV177_007790 [Coemansia sp. RSA 1804]
MSVGSAGISDIALLLSGAIKLKTHITGKPPYSYATLITYAIMNHPRKQMTLNEIYSWVMEHYPYFKTAGSGWKNSIRHNLSLSKTFVRIPRPINEPGKGAYWTVDLAALEATMNNQPKPPTLQFQPLNEQQLCNASRGSVITPCYPPAQPGIPAVLTQGLPAGSITAGSFAMGMTSSISEMGLLQNAPSSESAIALRRASLQVLPTHGRFQPYPAPGNGGLGRNRSQYHDLVPSPPHMQQILGSLNPFAMPISASTFGSANRRFQLQNPGTALGISTNTGPQPALPTIPTATDRNPTLGIPLVSRNTISTVPINLSSSSIHGSPADPVSSSNKPFSGALRQNGQAGGSSKDESTIKSASLDPKPKESTQRKNNEDYGMRSTQLEPTCKEIGHKSQEDHTDIEASGTSENTPGNDLLEYFTFGDT